MTSIISTASRSAAHDLLISGDTDGYIRLFRYREPLFAVISDVDVVVLDIHV
jgi:hypothetical protein